MKVQSEMLRSLETHETFNSIRRIVSPYDSLVLNSPGPLRINQLFLRYKLK